MKNVFRLREEIGWRDHVVGFLLGAIYVALLLATARTLGFARDEGFYFRAAIDYGRWFKILFEHPADAMQRSTVDSIWHVNHEHPSLMKSLFSLSHMFFYEKWHVFRDASTAFRFPGMAMAGLAVWVTYIFGSRVYSRTAGLCAGVLFALMPRVFYNAHLACFDMAITAMWTLCIYVYWRAHVRGGWLWALAVGLVFGLTLETKHNAWILPAVFLPHWLFADRASFLRDIKLGKVPIPASLIAMAIIGPAVFYALWPWMWNDTVARIQEYVQFHVHHEYYNMEFLGKNYFGPPSPIGYMPIMIVATVPAITLLLFACGAIDRVMDAVRAIRRKFTRPAAAASPADARAFAPQTDLLLALALGAAVAPFLLPKTPIFGGTKHWMPAYPFLAIFAGRGFMMVARNASAFLESRQITWLRPMLMHAVLFAAIVIGPLAITLHSHPFGLSSYVPFVGGTAGGADLGLNRQFWGFTTQSANAEYLEKNAPPNSSVFIHDTAWDAWSRMTDEKRVRPDLRAAGSPTDAQFALIQHELHMAEVDYQIWIAYGTRAPAYVVAQDGVPIVSIYKRP